MLFPSIDIRQPDDYPLYGPAVRVRWIGNLFRLLTNEAVDRDRVSRGEPPLHEAEIARLRQCDLHPSAGQFYPDETVHDPALEQRIQRNARRVVDQWLAENPETPNTKDPIKPRPLVAPISEALEPTAAATTTDDPAREPDTAQVAPSPHLSVSPSTPQDTDAERPTDAGTTPNESAPSLPPPLLQLSHVMNAHRSASVAVRGLTETLSEELEQLSEAIHARHKTKEQCRDAADERRAAESRRRAAAVERRAAAAKHREAKSRYKAAAEHHARR